MDDTARSSFIPKQSAGMIPTTVRKRKRFYVFGFLGTVILVGSLLLAVGVYFYKLSVQKQLDAESQKLASEKNKFSEEDILSLRSFQRKLDTARFLLDNHLSPSKVFDALELHTLQKVQFTKFGLSQRPSQDLTLHIEGGTEDFKVVALQALQLNQGTILEGSYFSNFTTVNDETSESVSKSGEEENMAPSHRVSFTITGNISASLVGYDGTSGGTSPVTHSSRDDGVVNSLPESTVPQTPSGGRAAATGGQ